MCSGPVTLLAPTNAAFDALDPTTVQQLLLPENSQRLQDLLLYHILPGLFLSDDLDDGPLDTLLTGQSVSAAIDPIIFNGRARVIDADIIACNGVIYTIDDVLVPGTYLIAHCSRILVRSPRYFSHIGFVFDCSSCFL